MNLENRVAAVEIATKFQERSNEVFKMVEEEMEFAKTQVCFKFIVQVFQVMMANDTAEENICCYDVLFIGNELHPWFSCTVLC